MKTVLVVEDHPVMRQVVINQLARAGNKVIGHLESGYDVIQQCREKRPDFVVLDLSLPGCNGLEITKRISEMTFVIILTAHDDYQYIESSLKAGAMGYVSKDDLCDLSLCVNYIDDKDTIFLSRTITNVIAQTVISSESSARKVLTNRESQIVQLLEQRKTNDEIAKILKLKKTTVERHKSNIYKKTRKKKYRRLRVEKKVDIAFFFLSELASSFMFPFYRVVSCQVI